MKRLILASFFLCSLIANAQEPLEKHLIKFLKTSSNHSDYAVSFYGDSKLVFSSPIDNESKRPKHDLFIADVKPTGQIENKASIGFDNRTVTKTGLSLNRDRNVVYFSAKNKRKGKHQLFKAEIDKNGLWTNIIRLPFNKEKFHYTAPALSTDNKKLYFVSDNRESYGGTDIFMVDILEDGSFSTPKNLGKTINTAGNEITPFVSNKEILYFSSDGRTNGKGGLDVYKSAIEDATFAKPTPIDAPINGANNDFGYIINSQNNRGYFSSNRLQGDDNNNLYSFLIDIPKPEECEQIIAGIVKDKVSEEAIAGAKMTLFDKNQKEVQQILTDENGNYSITMPCNETFTLIASGESYNKEEHIINTANYTDAPALSANKFLVKDPNYIANSIANNDLAMAEPSNDLTALAHNINSNSLATTVDVELPNVKAIYFDFDKSYIKQTARPQLDEIIAFMEENPSYKIELSAYTDARGPKSYNLLLSQRRVKSTMRYLNAKGIEKNRISGKGYGEANITNNCEDDVPCTRAQHKQNRRTEFTFVIDNVLVETTPNNNSVPREIPVVEPKVATIKPVDKPVSQEKIPEIEMPDLKLVVSDEKELKELVDKGVVVEGTSIIDENKAKEIAQDEPIKLTPIKSLLIEKTNVIETSKPKAKQVKLTNDTSHIINIKAMTTNDQYNRLLEKGVIEENKVKEEELVKSDQPQTSKETLNKLEKKTTTKLADLDKPIKKELPSTSKELEKIKEKAGDSQQTQTSKETFEKLEQLNKNKAAQLEKETAIKLLETDKPTKKEIAPTSKELQKIKEEAGDLKQTETSKETLNKLEQLYKNKQKQQKLDQPKKTALKIKEVDEKEAPKKTSYNAIKDVDKAKDPNAMLAKVKEQAAANPEIIDTKKEEVKLEPETTEVDKPKIEVKTFSVTPMTSKRGKYMQTDRAKKIQALRVIFNLENYEDNLEGYHDAYIIVESPDGKVINQKGTFALSDGEKKGFTDETTIFFNNQNIKVVMFIDRIIQKFVKGTYNVYLYTNGYKLASNKLVISA